ncbi:hypothetical protein [Hymenobacter chitinivorans]|uniref:Uncharacterized protein n=1 Tax=Hymenobacter chitinivorans DSM 11115 TaxID=1121954 RepID=A0A2M9B955_9BACT|nr:hypothetical protein [Hymenobacter chitinivorans]PJJ54458.1 hypothetical protein CLV45_2795 [Hymenobacter chitinivorans DSM 11115]
MPKLYNILCLLCLLVVLTIGGCTKKEDPALNPDPPLTLTSTLDKTSVTPGDVVVITTSDNLSDKPSWEVLVGGRKVVVAKLEANQASFVVPVLATGPVSLDLTAMGVKAAPALTMTAYPAITDPAPVLADFEARLAKGITYLDRLSKDTLNAVPGQNVASMRSLQKAYTSQLAALTIAQKIEVAYVLQKITFDEVELPQRRTASADPSDDFMTIGKAFVVSSLTTTACIAVFAPLAAFPDPVSKVLACAVATQGILSLMTSLKLIQELCNRFDLIAEVGVLASNGAAAITLGNEQLTSCLVSATGRTLAATDAAGSAFMQKIFAANAKLEKAHAAFTATFTRIKSWFGDATAPTPYVNPVKAAAARAKRNLAANLVKIQNVSRSAITLIASVVNNQLTLRASSTTITATVTFTFDVVYDNAELGIQARKTITATYNPQVAGYTLELLSYDLLPSSNGFTNWTSDPNPATYTAYASVQPGQAFSSPQRMQHHHRLKLNGVYVKTRDGGNISDYGTFSIDTGQGFQSADVHVGTYQINVYDATNNRSVSIPVDLTIDNSIHRMAVGKTLRVNYPSSSGSTVRTLEIILRSNGTYSHYEDGKLTAEGTYRLDGGRLFYSQVCGGSTVRGTSKSVGGIYFDGHVVVNNFFPLYEDGSSYQFLCVPSWFSI